MNRLEL